MIQNLVFLLEESSAKAMLQEIVPQLIDETITVKYLTFEGKQDLERNLARKLRDWQFPNTAFIVLRDQDSANCIEVKQRLKDICTKSGKPETLVRIACHELESFYLGDLEAVSTAYNLSMPSQNSRKFRDTDKLSNAADELSKITNKQYQKIDGSRRIGHLLKLDGSNRSHSFNVLCDGIRQIAAPKSQNTASIPSSHNPPINLKQQ